MLGKGAIIIVLGFVMAFSNYQVRLNHAVIASAENFNLYYIRTVAHEEALSAMNMAINKVWANNTVNTTYNVIANQCTSAVQIYEDGLDTVVVKVKTRNYLFNEDYYVTHNARFKVEDSVFAFFAYNMPISRYFWFTNYEGSVYWTTSDTVWGPVHTNDVILTTGYPTFFGKVTAYKGISPNPNYYTSHARFYGGWEIGVRVDIPTDMSHLLNAANLGNGSAPVNTQCVYNQVTTFNFLANGKAVRKVGSNPIDTVTVATIAPTGVIYSSTDVRVKGQLNGRLTIYSADDIWIDDDVVYVDDPVTNPASNDFLGLVANNRVIITDNAANNNNVNVQACIMAVNGSFTAQNYSTRPPSGYLRVTGSIAQKNRGPVGTFSYWGISSGFSKRYRFDTRCASEMPPSYPYVRALSLVSWWE
jgi:hypothetical protein